MDKIKQIIRLLFTGVYSRSYCIVPALIAAAASVAASRKNAKDSVAAAEKSQQNANAWNLQMAEKSNKWNEAQVNKANAYNSPAAIMSRLKSADINPDLAISQGVSGMTSVSPIAATTPAASSRNDYSAIANMPTMGDAALKAAQINNINAQTEKVKSETEGQQSQNQILASDASFRDAINSGTMALNGVTIQNINQGMKLSNTQIDYLRKQTSNLDIEAEKLKADIDNVRESTNNISFEQALKSAQLQLNSAKNKAEIQRIAQENNLTVMQVKQIGEMLPGMVMNQASQGMLMDAQRYTEFAKRKGIEFTNEGIVLNLKDARTYDQATDSIGFAGRVVRVGTQLVSRVFGGSIGNIIK